MLFDLKGKRRRVVQATYLTLAVLMGGGLILFGIGGDVSGGLFDAFSERGGLSRNVSDAFENRIDDSRKRLRANPRDEQALKALVRSNYQLASAEAGEATTFPPESQDELRAAARAWERYLALDPDPVDEGLARLMLQAFSPGALNQAEEAVRVAELLTREGQTPQAYITLTQFAALAGQSRKADLAGEKAVDLAEKDQRELVEQQVEQAKAAAAIQQTQGQQQGHGGGGSSGG